VDAVARSERDDAKLIAATRSTRIDCRAGRASDLGYPHSQPRLRRVPKHQLNSAAFPQKASQRPTRTRSPETGLNIV
jgi:hypothetical protein